MRVWSFLSIILANMLALWWLNTSGPKTPWQITGNSYNASEKNRSIARFIINKKAFEESFYNYLGACYSAKVIGQVNGKQFKLSYDNHESYKNQQPMYHKVSPSLMLLAPLESHGSCGELCHWVLAWILLTTQQTWQIIARYTQRKWIPTIYSICWWCRKWASTIVSQYIDLGEVSRVKQSTSMFSSRAIPILE